MTKTKRSLAFSVISLLLCIAMLLGTTFAWFTDAVTSGGNIIQSGNLRAEMYWSEDFISADSDEWKNADGVPVFNYDNWEPGYTDVKYIKIKNAGNLSFKWQLSIEAADEMTELADVLDVYYVNQATQELTSLAGKTSVGTLSEVVEKRTTMSGALLPFGTTEENYITGETVLAIALHMQEDAGNEYMTSSIGDGFELSLIATQFDYESDSFGSSYDTEAKWPEKVITGDKVASAPVTPTAENKVGSEGVGIDIDGGKYSASIPEGVQLEPGTTKITLAISNVSESQANITLDENEASLSLDVHVHGVAENNDVVIKVYIAEALPIGLNMGNYRFYHVEDGATVEMTLLADGATPVHNNYEYDAVTGDVVLYLKSFSEVALVADTENKWEGNFDYSWYTGVAALAEGEPDYIIANADQLAAFGAIVGGMDGQTQNSFSGKTVKLVADVNLGDKESENNPDLIFYPIGYNSDDGKYEKTGVEVSTGFYSFMGTFDGNGNTISNFYHNTWEMKGDHNWYTPEEQYYRDGMGLFGRVYGGTVKNLTVDNFSSDGEIATTGVIAAYAEGATFENIAITNCNPRVYNIGNGGIVGCVGWYAEEAGLKTTFKNITVDNSNKISALWGSYDVACGGIVGQYYPTSGQTSAGTPTNGGIEFTNCHVSAQMDVYNDVCANYQYYAYRYAGMLIGSVRENETIDGHVYPKMDGITASGCTVHFGTWNDYYYCELVANSLASYTHDHQFSRLEQVAKVEGTTITPLTGDAFTVPSSGRYNYVVVNGAHATENATCYHFVDGKVHDHDDYNGDGVDDYETVNGESIYVENNRHIYLEFNNLVTGYGWGVTSRALSNLAGVTNLDITQGDQEESVEKFESNDYTPNDYRPGETITIGDLFKETGNATINVNSVYVFVSPVDEGDTVNATFQLDTTDWTKSTITFTGDSKGTAKVTITDYIFCTPKTIYLYDEKEAAKFTDKNIGAQNAYTQLSLDDIFDVVGGANIGNVTATFTDPNGLVTTVKGTSTDWTTKTIDLIKDGEWKVSIVDDDQYCAATETIFIVNKVDKFEKKFTGNFLYRVGNANAVAWTSLFADLSDSIAPSNLSISVTKIAGNAEGTFDYDAQTVKFTGTGVVKVTISADGANPVELNLEVVSATNVAADGKISNYGTSSVLLGNTTVSTLYLNDGATLYGNGFTIDCTNSPINGTGNVSENYIIGLAGANLDNVKIVGKVYTEYGAQAANDYNRALIISTGNSTITNCYLSNTAAPVRINSGNLTITGSTLKGGNFANIDVRSGHLILDSVTTINQALGNDKAADDSTVIGLGIVVYYETVNTSATSITVKNGLKQYNHISSDDEFSNTYANQFVSGMFDSANSALQYSDGSTTWVNTGVILMTDVNVNGAGDGASVSFMGATGKVYTTVPTAKSVAESPAEYTTLGQGVIAPSASIDHDNEEKGNYIPKEADKNDYCYFDGSNVLISMDKGDTFQYDPFILNATKLGNVLGYTVKLNGNTVESGSKISFNEVGNYTITYTYEDPYNYSLNENGELVSFTVSYTKTDVVSVAIVEAEAEHAKFTFATNSTATEEILYNNNTYVSATGVTADGTTWGKITIGDKTIIYPIVTANVNRNTTNKECQVFYYVFKNVISITDANGTVYSHDNGTGTDGEMPSNLVVIKGNELKVADNVFTNYNDSNLSRTAGKIFCYSSSSQEDSPEAFNGALAYKSPSGLSYNGSRNYDAAVIVQYMFTDSNNATYYYYVGYKISNPSNASSGDGKDTTCVTPDTLVTLADGTQVRVDSLTGNEELLVWNMETGKLDKAPIMFVDSEAEAAYEVIKLYFSDGTEVKVISEHGFWDYDLNKYVYLDENAADYIGHTFAKQNGNALEKVTLVDVVIETEVTTAWSPVTVGHLCYFVNGMLSMPGGVGGLFNIFEVDAETMTYDLEAMQKDIETYGLYTYEELNAICPLTEEMFYAAGGAYLKVSIGKGNMTIAELIEMINRYSKYI